MDIKTKSSTGRFLKKLSKFIDTKAVPTSKVQDKIPNVRYAPGEGERLLKASYSSKQLIRKSLNVKAYKFTPLKKKISAKNLFVSPEIIDEVNPKD